MAPLLRIGGDKIAYALAALTAAAGIASAGATGAPSTSETYPGQNGRIAFVREVPSLAPRCASNPSTTTIWSMNPDGSELRQLTTPNSQCLPDGAPAWSPDGGRIAFMRGALLMVMNEDGSGLRRVYRVGGGFLGADVRPTWSPSGRRLLFLDQRNTRTADGGIRSGPFFLRSILADGTGLRTLLRIRDPQLDPITPRWSPRENRIAFINARGLQVMRLNGSGRRTVYAWRVSRRFCRPFDTPSANSFDWSPDGKLIVFTVWRFENRQQGSQCIPMGTRSVLFTVSPNGTGLRQVHSFDEGDAQYEGPVWSPDGRRILLHRIPLGGGPPYGHPAERFVMIGADEGERQDVGPADDGCRISSIHGPDPIPCPVSEGTWQPR